MLHIVADSHQLRSLTVTHPHDQIVECVKINIDFIIFTSVLFRLVNSILLDEVIDKSLHVSKEETVLRQVVLESEKVQSTDLSVTIDIEQCEDEADIANFLVRSQEGNL